MGRRSTKTTKTGKFMNPTDQWRKEQRRKELKKNKKQRSIVREAVLRMKDPIVILTEIEELEKAESEAVAGSADPLPSEKGLLEKKRKLHSNLDRILKYWQKEDPKKAHDVKQLIIDSEKKRRETTQLHDSYREARSQCEVSDIPLPDTSDGAFIMPSDIPMPDELAPPPPSHAPATPTPPGPPPGAPTSDLRAYTIMESSTAQSSKRSVRFAAEDEDDDDMMGEEGDEENSDSSDSDGEDFDPDILPESLATKTVAPTKTVPPAIPQLPPPPPPGPPPLFAPRFPPPGVRLPPGPPPGIPPRLRPPPAFLPPPRLPMPPSQPHIQSQAIISSHPRPTSSSSSSGARGGKTEQGAIISAQPRLRNIQAEVTKFMPTSLRVRREVPKHAAGKVKTTAKAPQAMAGSGGVGREGGRGGGLQGDAYESFMKEMEGIL